MHTTVEFHYQIELPPSAYIPMSAPRRIAPDSRFDYVLVEDGKLRAIGRIVWMGTAHMVVEYVYYDDCECERAREIEVRPVSAGVW